MGDNFFKIFFICCFVLLFIVGGVMFFQMERQSEDQRSIKRYVESRGKAPVPRAWREKIGGGI